MNHPDPIYTPGSITFGHQAESNWHKAEAQRLDEENLRLRKRLTKAIWILERCIPADNNVANERILFLQREEDEL
jgi:hypothetical protein